MARMRTKEEMGQRIKRKTKQKRKRRKRGNMREHRKTRVMKGMVVMTVVGKRVCMRTTMTMSRWKYTHTQITHIKGEKTK
jgi:hypothetical protein